MNIKIFYLYFFIYFISPEYSIRLKQTNLDKFMLLIIGRILKTKVFAKSVTCKPLHKTSPSKTIIQPYSQGLHNLQNIDS